MAAKKKRTAPDYNKERLPTREKRAMICELRRAGCSLQDIAEQLGCTKQNVHQHLAKALALLDDTIAEDADAIRTMEHARLDEMQAALWPAAMKGRVGAVAEVLKIHDRRMKLHGLDAPIKHQNLDADGRPTDPRRSPPALDRLLALLDTGAAGGGAMPGGGANRTH